MDRWHYFRAGLVERGAKHEWRDGYARVVETGGPSQRGLFLIEYPWLTKREAQTMAKLSGACAVFHETREAAEAGVVADQT